MLENELLILILTLFAGLVGFIGQGVLTRLGSIDKELKALLVDHGQRITTLETRASFIDRRKILGTD